MAYHDIHDYGIIGDMNSCALIGLHGSIDWACFPRFDSPSVFAAILDDSKGGHFSIAPVGEHQSTQRYLHNTNVLETTFRTSSGTVTITDFMPPPRAADAGAPPHQIHRIVRGIEGRVQLAISFAPRFNYARGTTALSLSRNGVIAQWGEEIMALVTSVPLSLGSSKQRASAHFTVETGAEFPFVLAYGLERTPSPGAMDSTSEMERTIRFWEAIGAKVNYTGCWRDDVVRSFLVLHLLTYRPTGAVVAAPTTSLPETIGGSRNWDYRFCWLRDGAWTVGILARLGDPHEADAFTDWVIKHSQLEVDQMQILYGISPQSELREETLDHLEGYRGSGPVRIGNDAAFHRQLDVFGEVVLTLSTFHLYYGRLPNGGWSLVQRMANLAASMWRAPDRGIWEVRGEEQHFIYSKIMCWAAMDRAIDLVETHGYDGNVEHWHSEADQLKEEILREGWCAEKQSFTQRYGSDSIDASALLIPFLGFLPIDDPRVHSTIKRVEQELSEGPFVRRYIPEETDDGLGSDEGAFFMLSFWLIGGLLAVGERDEALKRFEQVSAHKNHLGLFSEMIDPRTLQALGNFPQAFSHIGFIHTARNLSKAQQLENPEEDLIG